MSWKETSLGELFDIKHGYAFKSKFFDVDGEHVVTSPGHFHEDGGFRQREGKEKLYKGDFPPEYLLSKNDIIIAMTEQGEGLLGSTAIIPEDDKYLHNQRLGLVTNINHKKIFWKFIYYLINTFEIRSKIASSATGTKVKHTAPKRILELSTLLPPLIAQQKIASILSAYDDLIDNNLKRIKLLEEAAQNIYKEWFVHFRFPGYEDSEFGKDGLPQGWERKGFNLVAVNNNKQRIPLNGIQRAEKHGKYPYYGATDIMDYVNEFLFDGRYLLIAEDGSVQDENGFPVLQLVEGQFWVNNHAHIISGSMLPTEFLFLALKQCSIAHLITGAVQPKLSMGNLNKIELVVPTRRIKDEFMQMVLPMINQRFALQKMISKLKETRDILLPRLMNQTIEV